MRRLVPAPLRRAAARLVGERRAYEIERELAAIARGTSPIVVGPWLGEVGFELLYWVPFVAWAAHRYRLDPDRLIVVSRGGAATWYGALARHSMDVLALMPVEQFRAKNDERNLRFGEQKQIARSPLDDELIERVRSEHGRDVAVLHPSLMYRLFAPYWWGHQTVDWVRRRTRHVMLQRPALALELPAGYTAVKFYFNDCFRNTRDNREFVERTIRALEQQGPVISLSTGLAVDDHDGYELADARTLRGVMRPETNLLVQSAVVAGARRFVGTYGGFAYLAPFYGVPADSYFSEPGAFSVRHLTLAQDALASVRGGGALHVAAVPPTPVGPERPGRA
jgi:hypothetical protein